VYDQDQRTKWLLTLLAISILQQSISTNAPSSASQFTHHLSLLSHKSDSQRKESLSYLTSALHSQKILPLPAPVILPKIQPLLLDASGAVRNQCLSFLAALPPDVVRDNVEQLLLYARAASSHLSVRVRLTGLDATEWLLNVAGPRLVASAGGWLKTLNGMIAGLGWGALRADDAAGSWRPSTVTQVAKSEDQERLKTRQLEVLSLLLETGFRSTAKREEAEAQGFATMDYSSWLYRAHAISQHNNPYGYLNLFASTRNEELEQYEEVSERARVYEKYCSAVIKSGLERMKREGGGVGRASMSVERVLNSHKLEPE
jgi:pre-rRNA-processing protein IPI1